MRFNLFRNVSAGKPIFLATWVMFLGPYLPNASRILKSNKSGFLGNSSQPLVFICLSI